MLKIRKLSLLLPLVLLQACLGGGGGNGPAPETENIPMHFGAYSDLEAVKYVVKKNDGSLHKIIVEYEADPDEVERVEFTSADFREDSEGLVASRAELYAEEYDDPASPWGVLYDVTAHHEVHLLGSSLGLAYSDFGYYRDMTTARTGGGATITTWDGVEPFFGGYDEKRIDLYALAQSGTIPDGNMSFSGKAAGNVIKFDPTKTEFGYIDALHLYGDARLDVTLSGGNLHESLFARFSDSGWYDVTVSGQRQASGSCGGGQCYDIAYGSQSVVSGWSKADLPLQDHDHAAFGALYYGDSNNAPTEVVGYAYDYQESGNMGSQLQFAFGAKR
ncbi:MAG: hypothetical protein LBQ63_05760 [Deltaproteobacteria bacterium]|jgi:hypothetical protein|nr:hypothetical protein [Deltaproteobacteria bacterium]